MKFLLKCQLLSISGSIYVISCMEPFGVITQPGTTILSANYPDSYENGLHCQVTITLKDSVLIDFEDFEVEDWNDCAADWLEVRDGDTFNSTMIGSKLCGSDIPQPMKSTGKSLTLVFISDGTGVGKGFSIRTSNSDA